MRLVFLALAAFLAMLVSVQAGSLRVVDGDTLELSGTVFRLHGIDAPEAGQTCKTAKGGTWKCGRVAIDAMEKLVLGKNVECDRRDIDPYGRTIGVCTADGRDINAEMVSMGLAWAFRKYSTDYVDLEEAAHKEHVGVWQAETMTPWDYRAERWAVAEQEAPKGCPIKGNISKNGKIYHSPWSPWYKRTKVSVNKGERWFCSEAEAISAGWRAPYWGK